MDRADSSGDEKHAVPVDEGSYIRQWWGDKPNCGIILTSPQRSLYLSATLLRLVTYIKYTTRRIDASVAVLYIHGAAIQ